MHSAAYAVLRCPSVTIVYCVETSKQIHKLFYLLVDQLV